MACIYKITVEDKELSFDSQEALVKYIRENQLFETLSRNEKPEMNTQSLANALRQASFGETQYSVGEFKSFQRELLGKFIALEEQAQSFYKVGPAVALTKGLGKDFNTIDRIKKNLQDLNINTLEPKDIPFDVRYLLTGNPEYTQKNSGQYSHKLTANNLKLMNEVDALSKTIFMERTPSFRNISETTLANLKNSIANNAEKVNTLNSELAAFSQIAAYKQWLKVNGKSSSTLRNSLIYDSEGKLETIVDIAKAAISAAPSNAFLQFILPVATTVKISKKKQKNIINRDLVNTIEGKTRGRLEPDMVANLMDSFTELYQNPATQFYAKALFDYLIVKDGLMFKNKSFIRMLPTFVFDDMSKATGMASELMSANTVDEYKTILKKLNNLPIYNKQGESVDYFTEKERVEFRDLLKESNLKKVKDKLYEKVFGMDYQDLYDKFEHIYATDVRHQYDLDLVYSKIRTGKTKKTPDSFVAVKADDGFNYLHINLFTDQLKALPKESEERANKFKDTLKELDQAGFNVVKIEDEDKAKFYIELKKYIRLKDAAGKYRLYQLVQVYRDKKAYTDSKGFIALGELIPRGTSGVYKEVQAVGSANTVGVADLGTRPTKEQQEAILGVKVTKEDAATDIPPAMIGDATILTQAQPVTTAADVNDKQTPPAASTTTVSGGTFGGFQILPSDDGGIGDMPLGFFSQDDVNNQPC